MRKNTQIELDWLVLKGYSIEAQLQSDGLTFQSFDTIRQSLGDQAVDRVQKKIVGRLAKALRTEGIQSLDNENDEYVGPDIAKIRTGVYVISVCSGFEIDYGRDDQSRSSRVLYVGSGAVYGRIKSHLSGKLFDFASTLPSVPLRFSIAELSGDAEEKGIHKTIEQMLLAEFAKENCDQFPLLNKNNSKLALQEINLAKGWDKPLQKDRGSNTTDWILRPANVEKFKGKFQGM